MLIYLKLLLFFFFPILMFEEVTSREKVICRRSWCDRNLKRESITHFNNLRLCAYQGNANKKVVTRHKKNIKMISYMRCCKCITGTLATNSIDWKVDEELNRHLPVLPSKSKQAQLLPIKTTAITPFEDLIFVRKIKESSEFPYFHKLIKRSIQSDQKTKQSGRSPGQNVSQQYQKHPRKWPLMPMFENRTYHVTINENSPQGTSVLQLQAGLVDSRLKMKTMLSTDINQDHGEHALFHVHGYGNDDTIQDKDVLDDNGITIRYRIENDEHDSFTINSKTGLITVKDPSKLDYEITTRLKVMVIAEVSHLCDFATLWIHLRDVNDNSPQFGRDKYFSAVYEDAPKGSYVTQISAEDRDSGQNGRILYRIVSGNINQAFSIDPPNTGIVKTNVELDREQRDFYRLEIEAVDQGDRVQRTGSAVLRVQVIDVNDNEPHFENIKDVHVKEGLEVNAVVTQLMASDLDVNTSFAYSIINQTNFPSVGPLIDVKFTSQQLSPDWPNKFKSHESHFSVEKSSGKVRSIKNLDREAFDRHVLTVQVSDGSLSSIGMLHIFVSDVNDNPPIFGAPSYNVSVLELTPKDELVAIVEAHDLDAEENSVIFYEIIGSELFRINKNTGEIYTTKKVVLNKGQHNNAVDVVVKATDGGSPPLSSVVPLRFQLIDINDHTPQFNSEVYSLEIFEDEKVDSTKAILKLSATDGDIEEENIRLFYFICKTNSNHELNSNFFHLDSSTGEMFLIQSLDREKKDFHQLIVKVGNIKNTEDGICQEPRNLQTLKDWNKNDFVPNSFTLERSFALVNITVLDVNDNAPKFSEDIYRATLPEDSSIDSLVLMLSTSDADLDQRITYLVVGGDEGNVFHLNSDTGSLSLRMKLDYEMRTQYILTIEAKDSGMPPLRSHCSVEVSITDVNEFRPIFKNILYIGSVQEGTPPNVPILTVQATDRDAGLYGVVRYKLFCLSKIMDCPDLQINPVSGQIKTKSLVLSPTDEKTTFNYLIVAEDAGGLNATVNGVMTVETSSRQKLRFENASYSFFLPGNSQAGSVVGRVFVVWNKIHGEKSLPLVKYSFLRDSYMFSINSSSGEIFLRVDLRLVSLSEHSLNQDIGAKDNDDEKILRRSKRHYPSPLIDIISATITTPSREYMTKHFTDEIKRSTSRSLPDMMESIQLTVVAEWDFPERGKIVADVKIDIDRSCNGCSLEAMVGRANEGFLSRSHLVLLVAFFLGILFVMVTIAFVMMMQRHIGHKHEKSGVVVSESDHATFRCSSVHSTIGVPSPPPFLDRNFGTVVASHRPSAQHQQAPCPIFCLSRTDEEVKLINNGITSSGCPKTAVPDSVLLDVSKRTSSAFHASCDGKEDGLIFYNTSKSSEMPHIKSETFKLLGNTEELLLSGKLPLSPTSMESIHLFSEEGGGESGWIGMSVVKQVEQEAQLQSFNLPSMIRSRDYLLPKWLSDMEAISDEDLVNISVTDHNSFLDSRGRTVPLGIFQFIDCLPDYHSLSDVYKEISMLKDEKSTYVPKTKPTKIVVAVGDEQGIEKLPRFYPPPILTDAPPPCWMHHKGESYTKDRSY